MYFPNMEHVEWSSDEQNESNNVEYMVKDNVNSGEEIGGRAFIKKWYFREEWYTSCEAPDEEHQHDEPWSGGNAVVTQRVLHLQVAIRSDSASEQYGCGIEPSYNGHIDDRWHTGWHEQAE